MRFKLIILFFISAIAIILGGRIIFSYIEMRNFSKSGNRLPELRAIALVINEYKSQFKRYPANLEEIENYIKSSKFPLPNAPISRDIIYIMPEENGENEVMLRCENVYGTFEYTVNNNAVYTRRKKFTPVGSGGSKILSPH
ncbi:MAG: hypothetical protein LBK76_12000 [Verrucomicrobiales bacterium]|nr:hypothetical protein [Verrucomicrobiales bacterium]